MIESLLAALPWVLPLALVFALPVVIVGIRVWRVRLRDMKAAPVDLARVPPAARSILDVGRRWLMPRGFRYLSSWKIRPMIAKGHVHFADVYTSGAGVFAIVTPREQPHPGDTTAIEFQSVFTDGTVASTFNRYRHTMVWEPPDWNVADDCVKDLDDALRNHVARVQAMGKTVVTDPAERDRIASALRARFVERLVASGKAVRVSGGYVHMRLGAAMAYALRLLRGNSRAGSVRVKPLVEAGAGTRNVRDFCTQAGVEADIRAYQSRRQTAASASGTGKWKLALVSGIAFVALGSVLWDPWFAAALLFVIAFHEGGHYLAMKRVGFRNLSVFFVPGLGGLATGEKQDATAAQKVLVYLAGPVPGIAVATAGLLWLPAAEGGAVAELNRLFTTMLVLNVINLLPVTPLDGGRVLEVLLFRRWPLLRLAFAAGSALVLIAAGMAFGERAMLLIGVLVVFSLPSQWRLLRLMLRVKRVPGEALDERSAARKVFSALAHPAFSKWNFQKRANAADELIAELRTPVPGIVGIAAGMAIYVSCFAAPVLTAWMASPSMRATLAAASELRETMEDLGDDRDEAPKAAAPARDWRAEIAASKAAAPDKRLAVLVEASEGGYFPDSAEGIRQQMAEIRRIADTLPKGDPLRGRAFLVEFGMDEDAVENASQRLRGLLEELRDAPPEAAAVKGRLALALAATLEPTPERLQLLVEGRDLMRERVPAGNADLSLGWAMLARDRARAGDEAGAEAEWKALLAWHGAATGADVTSRFSLDAAQLGYASFLMQKDRLREADAVVRPSVEAAMAQAAQGKRAKLRRQASKVQALFWIAVDGRNAAEARRWLDAWESAVPRASRDRNPQVALARLAMADLAGDTGEASGVRAKLVSLPATASLCRIDAIVPAIYAGSVAQRERELVERYGVCRA